MRLTTISIVSGSLKTLSALITSERGWCQEERNGGQGVDDPRRQHHHTVRPFLREADDFRNVIDPQIIRPGEAQKREKKVPFRKEIQRRGQGDEKPEEKAHEENFPVEGDEMDPEADTRIKRKQP